MKAHVTYLLVACLLFFTACTSSDGECRKSKVVVMGVSLYKTIFDADAEAYVTSPITERLTIKGVTNDSILYNDQPVSSFVLPLHALQPVTSFVVQRGTLGTDTIVIFHENSTNFISLECGCFVYHTIQTTSTTTHQIDSLVIENSAVQNVTEKHLRIYYHVNP